MRDWQGALLEHADDVVLFVGADNRIAWVSPRVTGFLGWAPEELVGEPVQRLFHEDDLPRIRELHAQAIVAGVLASGAGQELRARHRDGSYAWMAVRVTPVRHEDGSPAGGIVALRDAQDLVATRQALEQSEARYRSIIAALPDGVTISGLDGTIHYSSPAATAMFGLPDPEAAVGLNAHDVLVPGDRARAAADLAAGVATGTIPLTVYTAARPDGSTLDIEVTGVRIGDDEFVVLSRDITERRRTERALEATRTELVEAQRVAHVGSWTWDPVADLPA